MLVGAAAPASRKSDAPYLSPSTTATFGALLGFVGGAAWMSSKADSRESLAGIKYEGIPIVSTGAGAVAGWILGTLVHFPSPAR